MTDQSLSFFYGLSVLLAAITAQFLGRSYEKAQPQKRPYRWGYFWAVQGIIISVELYVESFLEQENAAIVLILMLLAGLYATIGYYTAKRRKWAFVLLTIFGLNPVAWILNAFYIRNRSSEFEEERVKAMPRSSASETVTSEHTIADSVEANVAGFTRRVQDLKGRMTKSQRRIVAIAGHAILLRPVYATINMIDHSEPNFIYAAAWGIYVLVAGAASYLWLSEGIRRGPQEAKEYSSNAKNEPQNLARDSDLRKEDNTLENLRQHSALVDFQLPVGTISTSSKGARQYSEREVSDRLGIPVSRIAKVCRDMGIGTSINFVLYLSESELRKLSKKLKEKNH